MLIEGSRDRNGTIVTFTFKGGRTISTNGKDMFHGPDAKTIAIWKAALEELILNNLIEDQGTNKEVFKLTRKGYDVLDNYRK